MSVTQAVTNQEMALPSLDSQCSAGAVLSEPNAVIGIESNSKPIGTHWHWRNGLPQQYHFHTVLPHKCGSCICS